jgi:hypothetical protein
VSQPQSARYQRSPRGLLAALLVLVLLLLAYFFVQRLTVNHNVDAAPTVDYAADVPAARKAAKFPLVAPPRLPTGWRATSVRFSPPPGAHWHLGVLTNHQRYVGLEQSDDTVGSMVEQYVDANAARGAAVDVAGRPWTSFTDSGGDLALVSRAGNTTTLVVGHDVPRSDLVSYTASLR